MDEPLPRWFRLAATLGMLLVPGCGERTEQAPRPDSIAEPCVPQLNDKSERVCLDPDSLAPPRAAFAVAALAAASMVDTARTTSTDTLKYGDSLVLGQRTRIVEITTTSKTVDSTWVIWKKPPPVVKLGIPLGAWAMWSSNSALKPNTAVLTGSFTGTSAGGIIDQIATARRLGKKIVLTMAGGAHEPVMTNGVFDMGKWKAAMQRFNTPAIRAAIDSGVKDGTVLGNSVMDEPHVHGTGDGNTWGPSGTMTKLRVDSMCGYVKAIFPTLPVGVVHQHLVFEPEKSYKVCDFLVTQYSGPTKVGTATDFRDSGLAYGKRDGIAIAFSMNILNGGIQAPRDGLWNCPLTTTGGRGTFDPNCRMTASQIRQVGLTLGPAGCTMLMWRWDEGLGASPAYQQAFKDIVAKLATLPAKSCRRTS
jgi:hypothetical protein